RKERQRQMRYAHGEHVVHPEAKGEEGNCDHSDDDGAIADQLVPGEGRDHHRNGARCGQKDDVDLWMPEQPEKMLPQKRVTASRWIEERDVECTFQFQKDGG